MKNKKLYIVGFLFLFSCLGLEDSPESYELKNVGEETILRVMTYNILANIDPKAISDGYGLWNQRQKGVFEIIRTVDADVAALQEVTPSQLKQIKKEFLEKYFVFSNEAYTTDSILLLRRSKYKVLEWGYYLLEDIKNISRIRRIAIWAKIKDKISQREAMVVSVHVDNNDWKKDQIRKLMSKLDKNINTGAPVVLLGDFNTSPESDNYKLITKNPWRDGYIGSDLKGPGTFPAKNPQTRIDHVLVSGEEVRVVHYQTVKTEPPVSDHLPVWVELKIEKAPK